MMKVKGFKSYATTDQTDQQQINSSNSLKNLSKEQRLSLVCNFIITNINEFQIPKKERSKSKRNSNKTPYFHITEPHTFEVVLIRLCFKEIPRTLEKHAGAGMSREARQESGLALI